jgi:hypothetical protein
MTVPYSSLPSPAGRLISSVGRFRQMTASQLRRLHYPDGSPRGKHVRSSRHLKRLTDLGLLRRVMGVYSGSAEYVYMPAGSKTRTADMHTLDISELYILIHNSITSSDTNDASRGTDNKIIFDPEPWCHVQIHQMTLKPDGYIEVGGMQFFYECDRGTEFRSQLSEKMRRYVRAYEAWTDPVFPLVIWTVPDMDRLRFIQSTIKSQSEPRLFKVVLFEDACSNILQWT